MIDVSHHKCVWTTGKTTEIGFSEDSFSASGVPLNVILPSFTNMNLVWFSIMFGDFNDNVLITGIPGGKATHLLKIKHLGISPFEKLSAQDGSFEEYVLSPEVQKSLGIFLDVNNLKNFVNLSPSLGYQIFIHDDCFSSVRPVDNTLLKALVQSVFKQHSYYLGNEIDWSEILPKIIDRLLVQRKISFKSRPSKRMVIVRENGGLIALVKSLFDSNSDISIREGKAFFNDTFRQVKDSDV